jgi:hypothetical protein
MDNDSTSQHKKIAELITNLKGQPNDDDEGEENVIEEDDN